VGVIFWAAKLVDDLTDDDVTVIDVRGAGIIIMVNPLHNDTVSSRSDSSVVFVIGWIMIAFICCATVYLLWVVCWCM